MREKRERIESYSKRLDDYVAGGSSVKRTRMTANESLDDAIYSHYRSKVIEKKQAVLSLT